jgi:uncharacterized membrane protein
MPDRETLRAAKRISRGVPAGQPARFECPELAFELPLKPVCKGGRMSVLKAGICGFATGAAFMYFADPTRGRRRRAVVRDKAAAGLRDVTRQFDKAGRDFSNRSHGLASGVRSIWSEDEADGRVLVERVRAVIGHTVSHPHAVFVAAEPGGRVILEGPVLQNEVEPLLKRVHSVPGVHEVENRLDAHDEPGNLSSLQGGVPRMYRMELAQENWTPVLRIAAAGIGAGSAVCSILRTDGILRAAGVIGGGLLVVRSVANRGFGRIFGIGREPCAVNIEKTLSVLAPVSETFGFWSNFENFPKFMAHLKEVRDLGNGRSHWVAAGPAGISIPWDAEINESRTNELLAWRSVPSSPVSTSGVVRFEAEPNGGTRISIRMSYCPPAGLFGHAVAWLFGADPKSEIDQDMVRLKSLLELGRTRAHGTDVFREEIVSSGGSNL